MEGSKSTIQVIIATHKKYRMPDDSMYLPLHVGAEGKKDVNGNVLDFGYTKDDTGDNISVLNSSFCELTGLYWAWKNINTDYIGLVHYRRHFSLNREGKDAFDKVLTNKEITPLLNKYKIFVPRKRKYYIETLYSHYAHTHYAEHLDVTRKILVEKYPEYVRVYDRKIKQRSGYMFNMMIMERKLFNGYCSWLFDILFELKNQIDDSDLSAFQGRFYGRVSEIIFNVWLEYQIEHGIVEKRSIKELPCIYTEKIDWQRKIESFLLAKILHKKYDSSF